MIPPSSRIGITLRSRKLLHPNQAVRPSQDRLVQHIHRPTRQIWWYVNRKWRQMEFWPQLFLHRKLSTLRSFWRGSYCRSKIGIRINERTNNLTSLRTDGNRGVQPYPNHGDEPDPLDKVSNEIYQTLHVTYSREYWQALFGAYVRTKTRGDIMWFNFVTEFRPPTIQSWSTPMMKKWRNLLTKIYI